MIATAFHLADQQQIDLFDEIRMGVEQGKPRNSVATFQTLLSQGIATTAGDS